MQNLETSKQVKQASGKTGHAQITSLHFALAVFILETTTTKTSDTN